MTTEGTPLDRGQLEAAIAAQEGLRATLGDEIVDTTISALRDRLARLDDVSHQRKLVSVLFMDVVGSTDLIQGLDPEETMAIMDSALARLATPVTECGGRVTRFMGDGFLAVFGLPVSRENDPEMAVQAGLDITALAERMAAELAAERGISGFSVRVGVNTGLVVTGGLTEAGDTVMGDAVNLAARLESAAPSGGVLISRDTLRHVRGRFDVEDAGTIQAKGFPDPVPALRVVGRAASSPTAGHGIEGLAIRMIGREEEMAALRAAFEEVAASGGLRAVTIGGEAGLGKSRLLDEFRATLDTRRVLPVEARGAVESLDLTYGLIRGLLQARYGIHSDDDAEAAREKLVTGFSRDLGGDPDGPPKAHFVGQLAGFDFGDSPHVRPSLESPQQIRSRAVLYLVDLFGALAAERPVLLVLEDLHWADAGSIDVIQEVLAGLDGRPVLALATARPSLFQHRPTWGSGAGHRLLHLTPLSGEHSEQLVDDALRLVADCPDELRHRLIEQAEGNPYYLEETIRMLIDDGGLTAGPDVWTVDTRRLGELAIPATLTGVIQARLDGLTGSQRTALQQASVVGRVFWDAALEHLAPENTASGEIAEDLVVLEGREMIHRRGRSEFSGAIEYSFHHEILRAVAYGGVLLADRARYHSLIAEWLIERRSEQAASWAGSIAAHLEKAGRESEALEYYCTAAESALEAYAVETAEGLFDRALALTPDEDATRRFSLLIGKERVLAIRGRRVEEREVLDQLASLATSDAASAQVAERRVWFHYYGGEYERGCAVAGEGIEAAVRAGEPALEARIRIALASTLTLMDEVDRAREEAQLAHERADEGHDDRSATRALNTLGLVAMTANDLSTAHDYLSEFNARSRAMGDLSMEMNAANNLGVVETQYGAYASARAHFERIAQIAAEVGDRQSESMAMVNLAWVTASQGEWPTARAYAEQSIPMNRAIGHLDGLAEALMWLGHALLGLGDPSRARDAYAEALEMRERLGQQVLAMGARAGLSRAFLELGDPNTALAHAEIICRHLDEGGDLSGAWEPMRIHLQCAAALEAAGHPDAGRVLDRARRLLLADADRITDLDARRSFLRAVPWHREILERTGGPPG